MFDWSCIYSCDMKLEYGSTQREYKKNEDARDISLIQERDVHKKGPPAELILSFIDISVISRSKKRQQTNLQCSMLSQYRHINHLYSFQLDCIKNTTL